MGLCLSDLDAPRIFKAEELNAHFSAGSYGPDVVFVSEYFANLNIAADLPFFIDGNQS